MARTDLIFSNPSHPLHPLLSCAQIAFSGSKEWTGSENGCRLKRNKNKIIILSEDQFTSPAHHVAVNNFSGTTECPEQVWEHVACDGVQQDAGTAYASAALWRYTHIITASVPLEVRPLRNSRWQHAPVLVCLLSCITICLVQTKQKGGQCRHLLGMTFPTRLRRGPQRHKRSREDPSGSSSAQSLLTRHRMADSREQRKGQN